MTTANRPRLALILEKADNSNVRLATWELPSDHGIDVTAGTPGIETAVEYVREYEPQDP